jgi:hypothetical protein
VYAEREGEFDCSAGAQEEGGSGGAPPPPSSAAAAASADDAEEVDVLQGFFSPLAGAARGPPPAPPPCALAAPLGRLGAPPLSAHDTVLANEAAPGDGGALLPLCVLAPLALPESRLRRPAGGAHAGGGKGAVRLSSTVWISDARGGAPPLPPAPPPLWAAAAAAAAAGGPRAPPVHALLRASLQAEGLLGVACATERRVATFMLPG